VCHGAFQRLSSYIDSIFSVVSSKVSSKARLFDCKQILCELRHSELVNKRRGVYLFAFSVKTLGGSHARRSPLLLGLPTRYYQMIMSRKGLIRSVHLL